MPSRRHTTQKRVSVPIILVVGSPDLAARCREFVRSGKSPPAHVKDCDVASAATRAAHWRPLAIVLTDDVSAFDAAEFDALAKDVSSTIIRVAGERIATSLLEPPLLAAVQAYWKRFDR